MDMDDCFSRYCMANGIAAGCCDSIGQLRYTVAHDAFEVAWELGHVCGYEMGYDDGFDAAYIPETM